MATIAIAAKRKQRFWGPVWPRLDVSARGSNKIRQSKKQVHRNNKAIANKSNKSNNTTTTTTTTTNDNNDNNNNNSNDANTSQPGTRPGPRGGRPPPRLDGGGPDIIVT